MYIVYIIYIVYTYGLFLILPIPIYYIVISKNTQ